MDKYLERLKVKHKFRDPLYGYIWLTDKERQIVDTPLFQRLRRVHQLALTKYVYPGAEHSRFVHSLGAVHAATQMFFGVFSHVKSKSPLEEMSEQLKGELLQRLRYAALLHDIGHLPFSHAAEKEWLGGAIKHEDLSEYIIKNYPPIADILGESRSAVANILTKRSGAQERLAHEIISGQLDADRADYLLRDSYHCGVKYGEFDWPRYSRCFWAAGNENQLALTVDEKDIYVAESFLMARYHYNLQVPYHKTRSGYDIVLRKFLKKHNLCNDFVKSEGNEIVDFNFNEFENLDDYRLFEKIKKEKDENCRWARMLLRENKLKAVIDTTNIAQDGSGSDLFKSAVKSLRRSPNLVEDRDFFIVDQIVEVAKWLQSPDDEVKMEPVKGAAWIEDASGKLLSVCPECEIMQNSKKEGVNYRQLFSTQSAKDKILDHLNKVQFIKREDCSAEEQYRVVLNFLNEDEGLKRGKDYDFRHKTMTSDSTCSTETKGPFHGTPPDSGTIWVYDRKGNYVDIKEQSWIFRQLSGDPLMVLRIFVTDDKLGEAQAVIGEVKEG